MRDSERLERLLERLPQPHCPKCGALVTPAMSLLTAIRPRSFTLCPRRCGSCATCSNAPIGYALETHRRSSDPRMMSSWRSRRSFIYNSDIKLVPSFTTVWYASVQRVWSRGNDRWPDAQGIPSDRRTEQCLICLSPYAMQSVRKPQRFTNLPISLKLSSTKRVWLNVVGAIKTAGVRILRIFVRILQTKFSPRDTVPAWAFIACIPMKSLVDRE